MFTSFIWQHSLSVTCLCVQVCRTGVKHVIKGLRNQNPHYYNNDKRLILTLANLLWTHTDRFKEALKWVNVSLQLEPDWEEAHLMHGKCLLSLGKPHEAKIAFLKTVSWH